MGMFDELRRLEQAPTVTPAPTRDPGNTGSQKPVHPGTQQTGKPGTREAGKPLPRQTTTPRFDINRTPGEKETFLCTIEEAEAVEDLKLLLRRRFDLRASKQDIERCAIQFIATDYETNGEHSAVVTYLKRKAR